MPILRFIKKLTGKDKRKGSGSSLASQSSIDSLSYNSVRSDSTITIGSSITNSRTSETIDEDLPLQLEQRRSSLDCPAISSYKDYDDWLELEQESFYDRLKNPPTKTVCVDDFDPIKQLGRGQWGNVLLVQHHKSKQHYAMKILNRDQISKQNLLKNVINEKCALYGARSPFIVRLTYHCKDELNLYMMMDYVECGDMFSSLQRLNKFSETLTKFYAAQIVLAFEYLHNLQLVYRDLKPENIMIDHAGFIKLIDLGFVKRITGRTYTLVGTPAYLAPEIILAKGYNKAIDWWTLGILIFEMMSGLFRTPFYDEDIMTMYGKIHAGRLYCPSMFSPELKDLLRQLLQTNPAKRLGNCPNGSTQIRNHSWFVQYNWVNVYNKSVKPPWKPEIVEIEDEFNENLGSGITLSSSYRSPERSTTSDKNNNNDNLFNDF